MGTVNINLFEKLVKDVYKKRPFDSRLKIQCDNAVEELKAHRAFFRHIEQFVPESPQEVHIDV